MTPTPTFYPIIDNGMGLSVTSWAFSMLAAIRGESVFCHISTPYPGYAMNIATRHFLDSPCQEMVVIDTDLVFTPDHLAALMEHDEPLVFGLYGKRKIRFDPPLTPLPGQVHGFPCIPINQNKMTRLKCRSSRFLLPCALNFSLSR
jgi:hypothetical protein